MCYKLVEKSDLLPVKNVKKLINKAILFGWICSLMEKIKSNLWQCSIEKIIILKLWAMKVKRKKKKMGRKRQIAKLIFYAYWITTVEERKVSLAKEIKSSFI